MTGDSRASWTMSYLCLGCQRWASGAPPVSVQHALSYCSTACGKEHQLRIAMDAGARWENDHYEAIARYRELLAVLLWRLVVVAMLLLAVVLWAVSM